LEFHVVADAATTRPADLEAMELRLAAGGAGPGRQAGDGIQWFEVENVSAFDRPGGPPVTRRWEARSFVPLLVSPEASMDHSDGGPWAIRDARGFALENGERGLSFTFDDRGAKMFGELTTRWYRPGGPTDSMEHVRLAVVVDHLVVSAPTILVPITGGSGLIEGGPGGFSAAEVDRLVREITGEAGE
jgi:hypothetical protein